SPFFFQAEDGIRDFHVTGVQTCALPISGSVTNSYVDPSTNSPGCRMNASSPMTSMGRVSSDWSWAGSMCGYLWLSKTRKNLSRQIGRASCREGVEVGGGGVGWRVWTLWR